MAYIEDNRRSMRGFAAGILILLVIAVSTPIVYNILFTSHAQTSHPKQAARINKCFDGKGTVSPSFFTGGRWGEYCNDGSEKNYWRIFECVDGERIVITQFMQRAASTQSYMSNHEMTRGSPEC